MNGGRLHLTRSNPSKLRRLLQITRKWVGVDMITNKDKERIAVQVKRSKNKIARKAISDAVAGMKYYNCNKAMVVTNSEFTEDAREFARGTECLLIDRTILQQWLDSSKRPQSVAAFGAIRPANN